MVCAKSQRIEHVYNHEDQAGYCKILLKFLLSIYFQNIILCPKIMLFSMVKSENQLSVVHIICLMVNQHQ